MGNKPSEIDCVELVVVIFVVDCKARSAKITVARSLKENSAKVYVEIADKLNHYFMSLSTKEGKECGSHSK